MPNKIALFDFCETLVDLQSGDAFIRFCIEQQGSRWRQRLFHWSKHKRVRKLAALFDRDLKQHKLFILRLLKGFTRAQLEQCARVYAAKIVAEQPIAPLIEELERKHTEGYQIWLVSGGYQLYLQHCFTDRVEQVVGCEIAFNGDRCTGKMAGYDCMAQNKPRRLAELGLLAQIDPAQSVVYSDSITDLPLFGLAQRGVVVSKGRSQAWAAAHGLEEILWAE